MAVTQNEIEELVVTISANAQQYMNELKKTQTRTQTWSVAVGTAIGNVAVNAFRSLTGQVVHFMKSSVGAAGNAAEALNKFSQVYGKQAAQATAFAEELADEVGRSSREIKGNLATLQSFFVGTGFAADRARGLSQQVQQLAIDFASFHNTTDQEAIGRFVSALSGSSEVLDQFGVNIKQTALAQEALRLGFRKSFNELSEQEKTLARVNVIMRAMGEQGAVGDAARTAGEYANQTRSLSAEFEDMKVAVGEVLLPAIRPLISAAKEGAQAFTEWGESVQAFLHGAKPSTEHLKIFAEAMKNVNAAAPAVEQIKQITAEINKLQEMDSFKTPEGKIVSFYKNMTDEQLKAVNLLKEERNQLFKLASDAEHAARIFAKNKAAREFMEGFRKNIVDVKGMAKSINDVLFHSDPQLGKHRGIFGMIGQQVNDAVAAVERVRAGGFGAVIQETGGQAIRAGTSEGLSFQNINNRTANENKRRDDLLGHIKSTLGSMLGVNKELLTVTKNSDKVTPAPVGLD